MEIKDFRTLLTNKMVNIPSFIDTRNHTDYYVWNKMLYIADVLLQLVSNKIIRHNKIVDIVKQFDNELDEIIIEGKKYINITLYYIKLLEYILDKSIEEELYECSTNVRNFMDVCFIKNNTGNGSQ